MSTVITIIVSLIMFGVLITSHEFGHFIAAKKSGVEVLEFSAGMGPLIAKKETAGPDLPDPDPQTGMVRQKQRRAPPSQAPEKTPEGWSAPVALKKYWPRPFGRGFLSFIGVRRGYISDPRHHQKGPWQGCPKPGLPPAPAAPQWVPGIPDRIPARLPVLAGRPEWHR